MDQQLEIVIRILISVFIVAFMVAFAGGAFLIAQGKTQYRQIRNKEGKLVGLVDRTDEEASEPLRVA